MLKNLTLLISLISSTYAISYCKINQYGHNLCKGERALLIISEANRTKMLKSRDLKTIYKVVKLKSLHIQKPFAYYKVPGFKKNKRVHVDQVLGNKLCEESNFCKEQKVIINKECLSLDDKAGKVYRISQVYHDKEFLEDIVEIKRGFPFKKTKLINESCLTLH